MVKTTEHDPYALLGFALRESDWELAEMVACFLLYDKPSRLRVHDEILSEAWRPGAPESLTMLHRFAKLSRNLDLSGD